jgi:SMC interacting uncharacterized protein involved in chromosome segregation
VQEEIEHEIASNGTSLENALKQLWERARIASEVITTLRNEKKQLQDKVNELESSMARTKSEALVKEVELEHLREEIERLHVLEKSNGSLNDSEKMKVIGKIKSLIEKINTYLITNEG